MLGPNCTRRVVAIVPTFPRTRATATRDTFAIRPLETFEARGALPVVVALPRAGGKVHSAVVIRTGKFN